MTFVSRSVRPFDVLGVRDPELESADRGSDDLEAQRHYRGAGAARVTRPGPTTEGAATAT